jgi:hypothetical protein
MLNVNLSFNILSILIAFGGLTQKTWQNIQFYNRLSCLSAFIYFPYDIYLECVIYKKYSFVPHHIISIIFAYKFYFLKNIPLIENTPMLLLCAEGTGFIVNLRTLLINNKKLTTKIDIILFIVYTLIRNTILTPTLYKIRKDNYTIWYSWFLILIMSNMWSYNWIKSIIKYYNKNKKLNKY